MKRLLPPLLLLLVLTAACFVFPPTVKVRASDASGVAARLPDQAGEWRGRSILFCLTPQCTRDPIVAGEEAHPTCPVCGAALEVMSPDEKKLLPADTVLVRKQYRNDRDDLITVSLVFSGRHRSSIHRPEVCLVGQGSEIVSQTSRVIPLPGRAPLRLKVLGLLHHRAGGVAGTYFAYWFVGPRRETPSHYARMFWMAWERVFYSETSSWAYLAISGRRPLEGDAYLLQLERFVADLYPQMSNLR